MIIYATNTNKQICNVLTYIFSFKLEELHIRYFYNKQFISLFFIYTFVNL